MQTRGQQYYAVMAMREEWRKPRFVWAGGTAQIYTYAKRKYATRKAKQMNADKQFVFAPQGTRDDMQKWVPVKWIVVPVWVETMPEVKKEWQ